MSINVIEGASFCEIEDREQTVNERLKSAGEGEKVFPYRKQSKELFLLAGPKNLNCNEWRTPYEPNEAWKMSQCVNVLVFPSTIGKIIINFLLFLLLCPFFVHFFHNNGLTTHLRMT